MSYLPTWIFVVSQLSTLILASPIYAPQFLSGGTGRNIRHLPCVSLRTGETGVCMFAFTCVKANGTHLGTCIDRFYFGSCCKLNDDPDIYPVDNTIEEGPAASSFVTTDNAIESNDIPDYFTRPKPIVEKQPVSSTTSPSSQITLVTTQSVQVQISTESPTIGTKRPFLSTPYTTTQPPMGLSTFQTLHNYSQHGSNAVTTGSVLKGSSGTSTRPQNPSTTENASVMTTIEGLSRPKPFLSTSAGTKRPVVTETTTKKPSSVHGTKHTVTRKPVSSSTPRPVSSTTERTPSTRFPPRNATTNVRPVQPVATTRKPGQYSATKKPSVTTTRPGSGTRKPVTAPRPASSADPIETPTTVTGKPISTNIKLSQTVKPPITSTQESATTASTKPWPSNTVGSSTEGRPSQRPITKRPTVTNGGDRITTSRPLTTPSRPRPSSKPTKMNIASSERPATVKITLRPQEASTEKIKPLSSSPSLTSSSSRPSTLRPSAAASIRPRPTERPTKPLKPTKPARPSPTTLPPASTSSGSSSMTQASTLSVTSSIYNGSTLINEVVPPRITGTTGTTTEKVTHTTSSPGLVTWSSNSDDDITKSPDTPSTTTDSTQEAVEPEWSPITTPDGWVIIQSLTTEKPVIGDEAATRPKPTSTPSTSSKPASESTTTERITTSRPTIPTILSTIATVTTASDLPVPMETLNMSDYKQVCGRRLFPESRIVGGANSTFGKWPWQISLRQWRTKAYLHKCGAALLNENWAITAAHCVENVPPSDLLLRIGEYDLANEDEPYGFQERRVQIVASHPQFDPRTFEYDLALLRFYEPIEPFQPNILPVCLPDDDENYVGDSAYVTGWGRLFEDGPLPSVLQEATVPVINNTLCEGMYRNAGYIEHIPHIFICAGWRKGGFDSCEGDSGGPMVIRRRRDKRWILAGVISWGIGCAEPNQPGVYTRISEFREWINQILQF